MKLNIEKIRISELESFVSSKAYQQFATVPITRARAVSYAANPCANPADVAVYLGFIDGKLVAFRTVFAGLLNNGLQHIRFAWCSGAWVHHGFRRQGFSIHLLNEALKDWNGKLMLTNYSPATEMLFSKSGKFQPIHQFHGVRAYLFPKTRKLLRAANSNALSKSLFGMADVLTHLVASARLWFFKPDFDTSIRFELQEFPDEACFRFLNRNKQPSVFIRGEKELKWIFQTPWISKTDQPEHKKYPFSSFSPNFKYYTAKIFGESSMIGFFIFSVREKQLKTLFFNLPEGTELEIVLFLKQFCKNNKIEVATIYNYEVASQLFKRKFPFLHAKKYGQKIYSSFSVEIGNQQKFQDGDGDVIFT